MAQRPPHFGSLLSYIVFLPSLALCSACESEGPSTSSSSHWLRCASSEDCAAWVPGAICSADNVCVGESGEPLYEEVILDADFSGGIEASLFSFEEGFSVRNGDLEFYTSRPENAFVEDGELVLQARREDYEGAEYTSASLLTQGNFSFTYGRVEARILAPDGPGIGPAFWLLPEAPGPAELYCSAPDMCAPAAWPLYGDMVVMTTRGEASEQVIQTSNFARFDETQGALVRQEGGGTTQLPGGVADGYHDYALQWSPGRLEWFIDGELTQSFDTSQAYQPAGEDVFSRPFHLRLSLAVGGLTDTPIDTAYPQEMRVASLRVLRYQE